MVTPHVVAVSRDQTHRFSKVPVDEITLVAGIGVLGDAHAGTLVQHRYAARKDPNQPNLRQVHLIQSELFAKARERGFEIGPGDLGENVTTVGIDLLHLPTGTLLDLGGPVVRLTGLRNPCVLINRFQPGLLKVVLSREDGTPLGRAVPDHPRDPEASQPKVIRRSGVMSVVERGGEVTPGARVTVTLPEGPHVPMEPV